MGRASPQRSDRLQRFFSTFPGSWPGLGLLLLRTIAGAATARYGGLYLAHTAEPTAGSWALGLLAIISGLALVAGFFTPAAAIAVSAAMWFIAAALGIDRVAAILVIADGMALALLGPGAHSIDAYLFGRREIIMPPDKSSRTSHT